MHFESFYSSSAGNLYRVSDGKTSLLIECGVPISKIRQALKHRLSDVAGCLLSHSHEDHSRAAKDLMEHATELHCSMETAQALSLSSHRLHIINPGEQFNVGTWTVVPFETEHDCPGSLGFLVAGPGGKLLFATDTFFIRTRFAGLTHIAIECNWSKETLDPNIDSAVKRRLMRSHMSLETCEAFLEVQDLQKVREIWLLHCSDSNSDAEYFRDEVMKLTGKPVHVAAK